MKVCQIGRRESVLVINNVLLFFVFPWKYFSTWKFGFWDGFVVVVKCENLNLWNAFKFGGNRGESVFGWIYDLTNPDTLSQRGKKKWKKMKTEKEKFNIFPQAVFDFQHLQWPLIHLHRSALYTVSSSISKLLPTITFVHFCCKKLPACCSGLVIFFFNAFYTAACVFSPHPPSRVNGCEWRRAINTVG